MKVHVWMLVCVVALAAAFSSGARAQQDSENAKQFWPEVDLYVPLNEKFRLFFGAPLIKLIHPKEQFVLDLYVTRHNDSHSQLSRVKALGMAFNIYF
jgi:hypothetical protein